MAGSASRASRVLMTGPLVSFADAYAAELRERGYRPLSIVNELRQVGRLSRWLEADGLSVADLSGGHVEQFLAWQRASGRHRCQWSRPGLACFLEVLRGVGVLAGEDAGLAGSPADLLLASFERSWLLSAGSRPAPPAGTSSMRAGSSTGWQRAPGWPGWRRAM